MRRKLFPFLLALALVLGVLPVGAQAAGSVVALKLGSPLCVIDSQVTQVDESNSQVTPYAVQVNGGGYTLLPIRRVLDGLWRHCGLGPRHQRCALHSQWPPGGADSRLRPGPGGRPDRHHGRPRRGQERPDLRTGTLCV